MNVDGSFLLQSVSMMLSGRMTPCMFVKTLVLGLLLMKAVPCDHDKKGEKDRIKNRMYFFMCCKFVANIKKICQAIFIYNIFASSSK